MGQQAPPAHWKLSVPCEGPHVWCIFGKSWSCTHPHLPGWRWVLSPSMLQHRGGQAGPAFGRGPARPLLSLPTASTGPLPCWDLEVAWEPTCSLGHCCPVLTKGAQRTLPPCGPSHAQIRESGCALKQMFLRMWSGTSTVGSHLGAGGPWEWSFKGAVSAGGSPSDGQWNACAASSCSLMQLKSYSLEPLPPCPFSFWIVCSQSRWEPPGTPASGPPTWTQGPEGASGRSLWAGQNHGWVKPVKQCPPLGLILTWYFLLFVARAWKTKPKTVCGDENDLCFA